MADLIRYLRDMQGWAASLEVSNSDTLEMLALLRKGHPRAQDFEPTGHGGSDPTFVNGTVPDTAVVDGKRYTAAIERAWRALREAEDIAHRYRDAVKPERQESDVEDVWCALHLELDAHEPRYRNELCRPCSERKYQTGDFPTLDDVRYHTTHGRWPRTRIDPKQPVTRRTAGLENLQDGLATLTEGTA